MHQGQPQNAAGEAEPANKIISNVHTGESSKPFPIRIHINPHNVDI